VKAFDTRCVTTTKEGTDVVHTTNAIQSDSYRQTFDPRVVVPFLTGLMGK
jgi:hypothetical protein